MDMMFKMCMVQMMTNMTNSFGNPNPNPNPNQNQNNDNTNNVDTAPVTVPSPVPLPGLATEPRATATRSYGPIHGTTTDTTTSRHTPLARRKDNNLKKQLPKL